MLAYRTDRPPRRLRRPLARAVRGALVSGVCCFAAALLACGGSSELPGPPGLDERTTESGLSGTPASTPDPSPAGKDTPSPSVQPLEGGQGKYSSVEDMPASDLVKDTISKMLEGSTAFVITDGVVLAIEDKLKTRTHCPSRIGVSNPFLMKCGNIDSVRLNVEDFPDSSERLDRGVLRGKYLIWEALAQSGKSFDDYRSELAGGVTHPFAIKAFDAQGQIRNVTVSDERTPWVIKYVSDPHNLIVENNTVTGFSYRVLNGVVEMSLYSADPGAPGNEDPKRFNPAQYQSSQLLTFGLAHLTDTALLEQPSIDVNNPYAQDGGYNIAHVVPKVRLIQQDLVPDNLSTNATVWNGILRTTGVPLIQ